MQVELQPSRFCVLPSSHCSPVSRRPLPHTGISQALQLAVASSTHCESHSVWQQKGSASQTHIVTCGSFEPAFGCGLHGSPQLKAQSLITSFTQISSQALS